jgi:hypothetical protein
MDSSSDEQPQATTPTKKSMEEKHAEHMKKYYLAHKEQICAHQRAYYNSIKEDPVKYQKFVERKRAAAQRRIQSKKSQQTPI